MIRSDPYAYRTYLDPLVYRSFVSNVVLIGAPSTGKTTLAEKLASVYNTVWMPEYGREYWETHQINRRLTLEQLVDIAEGHIERENAMLYDANRFLFTDTNALTTYLFSLYYHGDAHQKLKSYAASTHSRYDIVLLCGTDIPYDDTVDRSGNLMRMDFQKKTIEELDARHIAYTLIEGTLAERVNHVKNLLAMK
jgi:HTH-type transcriptional regulator, transcriptional repressor of NAD biosynthesis genes